MAAAKKKTTGFSKEGEGGPRVGSGEEPAVESAPKSRGSGAKSPRSERQLYERAVTTREKNR